MAVDQEIQNRVESFTTRWNDRVSPYPVLRLDRNWPSVGVLDLITLPVRGREQLSGEERTLVTDVAAYLAMLAEECWRTFASEVSVRSGERGITLSATGGEKLMLGERSSIAVEHELGRILRATPNPFPVLGAYERPLTSGHNLLCLFAIGLVTGLSPFVEGPWANEQPDNFQGPIEKVTSILGRQSIRWYERVHPDELYGQVGDLYLSKLIYPPTGMAEGLPGEGGVEAVVHTLREFRVPQKGIAAFSRNLALSPDELMSGVGLALHAAVAEDIPDGMVLASSEAKGTYTGLLRSSMLAARENLGMRGDWIAAEGVLPDDIKRFEIEKAFGLLPWVFLGEEGIKQKAKEPRISSLLDALAFFDSPGAIELCDGILAEAPGNIEVRLQRLYLDILNREYERADLGLKALLSEPGCEDEPRLFTLWGLCDLWSEQIENAVRHLDRAYSLVTASGNPLRPEVANEFGWALLVAGEHEKSLQALEVAVKESRRPLTSMLNKAYVLRLLERGDDADWIIEQCLKIAPLDQRVFVNAFLT